MRHIIIIAFLSMTSYTWSHGGGLDRYGCHNETKTGGYHCHRGSRASSSISNSGLTASDIINDTKIHSWKDVEYFEGNLGVVNFGCYTMSGYKTEFINRSDDDMTINFSFITLDKKGDPVLSFKGKRKIKAFTREFITLNSNLVNLSAGLHNITYGSNHCAMPVDKLRRKIELAN